METKKVAPYGSWNSPITSNLIVSDSIRLGEIRLEGKNTYWTESRLSEGGRSVVVLHTPDGETVDVTPQPFNVRTRVHEYGGGAFTVSAGVVYFSNFDDQRIYRQTPGEFPQALTPAIDMRYADGVIDHNRNRMLCVREDHTSTWQEPVNTIVGLDLVSGASQVLESGNNFYSSPRISPDGSLIAWLAWNHPNMPWDGTELWIGVMNANGSITSKYLVAGGEDESIFQPEWSPDGILHFVSDRTGWWNLYRWYDNQTEPLYEMQAEFGMPAWSLGTKTYGFDSANRIICAYTKQGTWKLASLNTTSGVLLPIEIPYSSLSRGGLEVAHDRVVLSAGSPIEATTLVQISIVKGSLKILRRSEEITIGPGHLSNPEAIEFPTGNGLTSHAFFYPPKNQDYTGPTGEKPPLLVMSHGGPTGATSTGLDLSVQFWTSRGIAVLDVNYGGSTGYGTAYRRRLNGKWGIVDVDDCVNSAKYLAERGEVDSERLIIRGGSAGGYTTLAALTFRDVFKAGASYYGISDLEAMTRDTHKFESRYLDTLIGPYPDMQELYIKRSPIHYTDGLSCPVIIFQGLEDKIVPPNQAEMMLQALRNKKLPVAYIPFEGEQHGFRRAENIKRALDAELYFYARVFGFELAGAIDPICIENL